MKLDNVKCIAAYEYRLQGRGWNFRFLAILSFCLIIWLHVYYQSDFRWHQWGMVALSSSVPFFCAYLLSFVQVFLVIFACGEFWFTDRMMDSTAVIWVRPESNVEYLCGKALGGWVRLLWFDAIVMGVVLLIHLFASPAGFQFFYYPFYFITLLLPALVFVSGLSALVKSFFRHGGMAMLLIVGIMGVFFLLADGGCWFADFSGHYIPNVFSEITGNQEMSFFLGQRLFILLFGFVFWICSVSRLSRLPNDHKSYRRVYLAGVFVFFLGASVAFFLWWGMWKDDRVRAYYRSCQEKYEGDANVRVTRHDIVVRRRGGRLELESDMTVMNPHEKELSSLVFYLNPGLDVMGVRVDDVSYEYIREGQVLRVDHPLADGDSLRVELRYAGEIDGRVCYLDVFDDQYRSWDIYPGNLPYRFERRYVYVGDVFTLLTPESLWYPVSVPMAGVRSGLSPERQFCRFSLRVTGEKSDRVLSQGVVREEGNDVVFTSEHALSALSLSIGDYERQSVEVRGVLYEVCFFRGHDFWSSRFTKKELVRELEENADYVNAYWQGWSGFPDHLFFVETPLSFFAHQRPGRVGSGFAQPEMLFCPERGIEFDLPGGKKREKEQFTKERSMDMGFFNFLYSFVGEVRKNLGGNLILRRWIKTATQPTVCNKRSVIPLSFEYMNFISSDEFPLVNEIFRFLQYPRKGDYPYLWDASGERVVNYLSRNSLLEACQDREMDPRLLREILMAKGNELREYLNTVSSPDQWEAFMKDFFIRSRYRNISLVELFHEFGDRFGVNLLDRVREMYTVSRLPYFKVKDLELREMPGDAEAFIFRFKIWNASVVDGNITVYFQGSMRDMKTGGGSRVSYHVAAGACREICLRRDERVFEACVSTGLSRNTPNVYKLDEDDYMNYGFVTDTVTGIFDIDTMVFDTVPGEIVVDNRDAGFSVKEEPRGFFLSKLFAKDVLWEREPRLFCYGDTVRDVCFRKARDRGASAEWCAVLPEEGKYEVFIYNPHQMLRIIDYIEVIDGRRTQQSLVGIPDYIQHYTVYHGTGSDEVELNVRREEQGWISVGKYDFEAGEARIVLHDQFANPNLWVFADAVKWVKMR